MRPNSIVAVLVSLVVLASGWLASAEWWGPESADSAVGLCGFTNCGLRNACHLRNGIPKCDDGCDPKAEPSELEVCSLNGRTFG